MKSVVQLPMKYRNNFISYTLRGQSVGEPPPSDVRPLVGTALLDVHICWKGGPTIVSNGSYLSTSIPAVTAGNEQGLLTRSLYPPQPTYDYSLQSDSPPNQTT